MATLTQGLPQQQTEEETTSCCSEGAWGQLLPDDKYVDKGVVDTVGDLDIYRVGNSSKCIIWNYDIFGFNAGRTNQLADLMADKGL